MFLPNDPHVLFSYLNTKLRDQYLSFDELCEDLEFDKEEVERILSPIHARYDKKLNKFVID